ncbi:MAG: hypothetical protein M1840_006366 [Geoglossum simile]|nr:MAG: hypothetical protein M1840_006366 [Geoglossum simile]
MSSFYTPYVEPASYDSSTTFPFEGCNIETASQEAIMSLAGRSPILHRLGAITVLRVSQKLALKCGTGVLPSEAEAMRFATANTSIRMPKVHRSFNVPELSYFGTMGYIVMDYIEGVCLASCWDNLDLRKRQDVVEQVSGIIRELQSLSVVARPKGCGLRITVQDPLLTDRKSRIGSITNLPYAKRLEMRGEIYLLSTSQPLFLHTKTSLQGT